QAIDIVAKLDEIARGANTVIDELDEPRVRLAIIIGNRSRAVQLARDYLRKRPSGKARALLGVAYLNRGGQDSMDKALDNFETALENPGYGDRVPEAIYYYGMLQIWRGDSVAGESQLLQFLRAAESHERARRPYLRGMIDQAKVQLGR
ncbi:hypothetical protein OAX78_04440, partial [Planctomycetota bacterium]|nr:hypothetical protein [Planctomycetota bacterium]